MQPAKEDAEACSHVPLPRVSSTGAGTKPATDFLCRRSGFKRPRPGPARSRLNGIGTAAQERRESRQAGRLPDNRWQRYALPQTLPSLPDESQTNPRRIPDELLPSFVCLLHANTSNEQALANWRQHQERRNGETISGR